MLRSGAGAHFKIPIVPSLDWGGIIERFATSNVRNVYLSSPSSNKMKITDLLPNFNSQNLLHKELTENMEGNENFQDDDDITNRIGDVTLHALPYYDIPFNNIGHTVIVMGSEVEGVSTEACIFAVETALKSDPNLKNLYNLVNIPMSFGSECLNTSVAGGILLYEARRQMVDL